MSTFKTLMSVHQGISKNRGATKWMVKIMENPIKMDDLGILSFLETPITSQYKTNTQKHATKRLPQRHSPTFLNSRSKFSPVNVAFYTAKTTTSATITPQTIYLVGGWTNPSEKYARQNGFIFPNLRVKIKNIWNHQRFIYLVKQLYQKENTWNGVKCPIFLGNFTPKTSNYCLKKKALGFTGITLWRVLQKL